MFPALCCAFSLGCRSVGLCRVSMRIRTLFNQKSRCVSRSDLLTFAPNHVEQFYSNDMSLIRWNIIFGDANLSLSISRTHSFTLFLCRDWFSKYIFLRFHPFDIFNANHCVFMWKILNELMSHYLDLCPLYECFLGVLLIFGWPLSGIAIVESWIDWIEDIKIHVVDADAKWKKSQLQQSLMQSRIDAKNETNLIYYLHTQFLVPFKLHVCVPLSTARTSNTIEIRNVFANAVYHSNEPSLHYFRLQFNK